MECWDDDAKERIMISAEMMQREFAKGLILSFLAPAVDEQHALRQSELVFKLEDR